MKNTFLEIANNIDKVKYIQKFIKLEQEWKDLNKEDKKECINIICKQQYIDDSFYNVILFMEDYNKASLINTISIDKAILIAKNISNERAKVFSALYLVRRLDNIDDFFDIIDGIDISKYIHYISIELYGIAEHNINHALRLIELLPKERPFILDGDNSMIFIPTQKESISDLTNL